MTSIVVRNNTADMGGGVYVDESQVTFTSSNIVNNKAHTNGGGFYIDGGASMVLLISSDVSTNNATAKWGGGIYHVDGNLTAVATTIRQNRATEGVSGGYYPKYCLYCLQQFVPDQGTI